MSAGCLGTRGHPPVRCQLRRPRSSERESGLRGAADSAARIGQAPRPGLPVPRPGSGPQCSSALTEGPTAGPADPPLPLARPGKGELSPAPPKAPHSLSLS